MRRETAQAYARRVLVRLHIDEGRHESRESTGWSVPDRGPADAYREDDSELLALLRRLPPRQRAIVVCGTTRPEKERTGGVSGGETLTLPNTDLGTTVFTFEKPAEVKDVTGLRWRKGDRIDDTLGGQYGTAPLPQKQGHQGMVWAGQGAVGVITDSGELTWPHLDSHTGVIGISAGTAPESKPGAAPLSQLEIVAVVPQGSTDLAFDWPAGVGRGPDAPQPEISTVAVPGRPLSVVVAHAMLPTDQADKVTSAARMTWLDAAGKRHTSE